MLLFFLMSSFSVPPRSIFCSWQEATFEHHIFNRLFSTEAYKWGNAKNSQNYLLGDRPLVVQVSPARWVF